MTNPLILASASQVRSEMLSNAGVNFETQPVKIDEDTIKASLTAESAKPRDIADALAEYKAQRAGSKHPTSLVLGSDQVLDFQGELFSKPKDKYEACQHLSRLSGQRHTLYSAAVMYQDLKPVWRAVSKSTLHMRPLTEGFIENYVSDTWDDIRHCVGCYQIEGKGVQLFSRLEGDQFTIMGLPLLEILGYLRAIGHMKQ